MTTEPSINERRVARQLIGRYIEEEYSETIQLEYRYAFSGGDERFALFTKIKGREYRYTDLKFFWVLSSLLDHLPLNSAIMIPHQVVVRKGGDINLANLEEWLRPYEMRRAEGTGTVVYQIRLQLGDQVIESPRFTSGYPVTSFWAAAEFLRERLPNGLVPAICYYCQFLYEHSLEGGTDGRHDELYCFRDNPHALTQLTSLKRVRSDEPLLRLGTPDMDALHSCAGFSYSEAPRP